MPNITESNKRLNQKILQDQAQISQKTRDCIKKEDCPMNGLCLIEFVLHYVTISCEEKKSPNCIKASAKQLSKNALQVPKCLLMLKPTKMKLNFPLSIGSLRIINSIHRCRGRLKGDINHTTGFPEDASYA